MENNNQRLEAQFAKRTEKLRRSNCALKEGEAQLRLITDNLPAVIVQYDAEMRFLFANNTAIRWYARALAEIIGNSIEEVLGETAMKDLGPRIEATWIAGPSSFEERVTYPDGITCDVHITYVPRFDEDGRVSGGYGLVQDISDRKAAAQELQESESRFRAIIDNSPSAILLKDTQARYVVANKRWHEWFNPQDEEITGKTVFDFYPDEHANLVAEMDGKVLETGLSSASETQTPFSDGVSRTTWFQKFPIIDETLNVIGIGGINTNITELKQAERVLQASEEKYRDLVDGSV